MNLKAGTGHNANIILLLSICLLTVPSFSASLGTGSDTAQVNAGFSDSDAIRPYEKNPWYFQFRGEPQVLRGASDIDCPFQWTGTRLTEHLDLLVSVGGNYIRNTMSDRNEGDVYAFRQTDGGAYDLDQWNAEYWNRLGFFLEETSKRGIIVQLTLWDQFDFHPDHPWLNNRNIKADQEKDANSEDEEEVFHEFSRSDFFRSIADGNEQFLRYQRKFVDKVLDLTLHYDHVLYNINNESSEGKTWENYWARHIKRAASDRNRQALVTTMQFDPLNTVRHIMTHSDLYDFYDISQNNQDSRGGRGQGHWDNLMSMRTKIASHGVMPMTNEKIYGGLDGSNYSAGTESEAIDRFWRNIIAGCAAVRFHRPALPAAWGSGLNDRVQRNLQAMDMFLEEFDIFSATPHNDLLRHRVAAAPASMEAYASAHIGKQYAVYFPPGRFKVDLDPWIYVDKVKVRWLDIDELSWSHEEIVDVSWEGSLYDWGDRGAITLKTPTNRPYVVLVEIID